MDHARALEAHYEATFGTRGDRCEWTSGPTHELPPGLHVLRYAPVQGRSMWTYATSGLSESLELHVLSPRSAESLVELLTVVAHYHHTGHALGLHHTVNFGRPWLDGGTCDYGLVSLPYLDGPKFQTLTLGDTHVQCLWLIPITRDERQFKITHGTEALEQRFEASAFNSLDPSRPSVVPPFL